MFLKNKNIIFKIRRSKVTDYAALKIVQLVSVCCISRSHRLRIDFQDENFENLLVWNHKA